MKNEQKCCFPSGIPMLSNDVFLFLGGKSQQDLVSESLCPLSLSSPWAVTATRHLTEAANLPPRPPRSRVLFLLLFKWAHPTQSTLVSAFPITFLSSLPVIPYLLSLQKNIYCWVGTSNQNDVSYTRLSRDCGLRYNYHNLNPLNHCLWALTLSS